MTDKVQSGDEVPVSVSSSDQVNLVESVSIEVYQSGGLVSCTRRLAALTTQASDPQDVTYLAIATILTAAAALEAILSEFMFLSNPSGYTKVFCKKGVRDKYKIIKNSELIDDHPEVSELWAHRIAIGHSEPENERSRRYGTRISPEGALWASETVEAFARSLWGAAMPNWFRSDTSM